MVCRRYRADYIMVIVINSCEATKKISSILVRGNAFIIYKAYLPAMLIDEIKPNDVSYGNHLGMPSSELPKTILSFDP